MSSNLTQIPQKTALDQLLTIICENAGAVYQGLQKAHGKHPALVLFRADGVAKAIQTTLALPILSLSSDNIKRHVHELMAEYAAQQSVGGF